jgi:regulator of sigma E protease
MLDSLQTSNPVSAIIAFFVVLIPLILVHEIGHFLAAKAAGITILEFGIGFPPRIRKLFTWRDTEFTLNWLPLGGFVRPLGEDMIRPLDEKALEKDREAVIARQQGDGAKTESDAEEAKARGIVQPKSVNEARPLGRIFFMAAGALANFLLALVLFLIVALLGIQHATGGSAAVLDLAPDSVLAKAGLQNGDVITDADGHKYNTSVEFVAHYGENTQSTTLTVLRNGADKPIDIVVPPLSDTKQATQSEYALILGVVQDAPADQAGIKPGDLVTAFNGQKIAGIDELKTLTSEHVGQKVTVTVRRGQDTMDFSLTPRPNPPQGQGAMGIIISRAWDDPATGLVFTEGPTQSEIMPLSFVDAVRYSASRTAAVITTTVQIPSQVISGALRPEDARPVSIIGVSQIGGAVIQESIQQGRIAPILEFIATISVALGFFNLLPIPALDGGRILFVLIEIVRGRPISPEREGLVHLIGLALLLSLSVLIILNDVINPITNTLR